MYVFKSDGALFLLELPSGVLFTGGQFLFFEIIYRILYVFVEIYLTFYDVCIILKLVVD